MHLVIKLKKKKKLNKKQDILDTQLCSSFFFYMYILHAMNTYIPDDLRRVSVSLLSWHRNTRMESAGNNIKRPNDDVALPVINTLRSRFLGLLRLYRWHELGVVGSIALGLHYVLCSQLYKSGILNGIRILNSSV